jgi:hypothetical protein
MGKMYSLTGNCLKEILPVTLEKYSMLVRNSSEHGQVFAAVIEDPNDTNAQQCVTISNSIENYFFSINRYIKPLSEKFGIGTYYLEDHSKADPALVESFIEKAKQADAKRKGIAEAKRQADEKEIKELPAKFPHLTTVQQHPKQNRFACCIDNIRKELKLNFPSVKFSVRKDHYDCISIEWNDGPTTSEVDKILNKFEDHANDVTGDFRDYSPSNFNKVFGGSKYVFSRRNKSPETENVLIQWAKEQFATGDNFGCHCPETLSHQLFSNYPVFPPFRIIKKIPEGGPYKVSSFFSIENL